MLSNKSQLILACFCLMITMNQLCASANEAMHDQKESNFSLYQIVLDKIVQRIQMNIDQNVNLNPSDIRLMFFLMSEINKRKEITAREENLA